MNKFSISIYVGDVREILFSIEPGYEVPDLAARLSVAYGCRVSVSMFARNRWVFEDGVAIVDSPDLTKFYIELDPQDEWDWSCYGKFPKPE